jgi:hypothetical protein
MTKATLFILASFAGTAFSARAALPLEDRGATTYDPNTGLEWLDLSFTAGRSYDEVAGGWGGYTTSGGYRFATRNEVIGLFAAFGENRFDQQANVEAASKALLFMGTTLPMPGSNLYRSWMNYDRSSESNLDAMHVPTAAFGTGELGGGVAGVQGFFAVPGLLPTSDYQSPEIANALVRVVPEPASWAIVALGVGILAIRTGLRSARRAD